MSCKKKCPKCDSRNTKKKGKRNRKQRYKCNNCQAQWGGQKQKNEIWISEAYKKYAIGRQTLSELSNIYNKSSRTIQKLFDDLQPVTGEIKIPDGPISVVMDATFFSRRNGVLVVRANSRNIVWREIETEKVEHYEELIQLMLNAGIQLNAFVIDGRRGVLHMLIKRFEGIPIQLCQFHQIQTMTKYLSKKPKLQAGKELRRITLTLTETDHKTFTGKLNEWHEKWIDFLAEKTHNTETGRWHYTHRRLRSAYRSVKNNLSWLFTHQKHPGLKIPNTTNSCDGSFAHWKNRLRVHRGLRRDRKRKMMNFLLENC